jgi:hypothetical protein
MAGNLDPEMPSDVRLAPVRQARRARYLVPLGTPRRGEVLAAAAVAAVLAAVLFAPLTLILAAAFDAVSRASRWRPLWLSVPAGCGAVWVLAIGPAAAVAGLRRGPAAVAGALAAGPAAPARLPGLVAAGLPGQFPLALILAAAAGTVAWWLRWLHTDEWDLPRARAGLLRAWRRRRSAALLRAGRLLTRDGACLGVEQASGRAAVLSWREAGGGVLVTGAAAPAVLASGLQLAHAAIRRRKPVIVVDVTGDRELPGALAAICAAARAPLHLFGEPGGPRYEPRLRPAPEQQAALAAVPWGPRGGPAAVTGASLADVVRQRAVALFSLGRAGTGDTAALLAGLVAADTAALYAGLYRGGIAPDGLCWLTECGGTDPAALAGLIAAGSPTGLAPVLATTAPGPAARIAGQVNAVVVHRLADHGLAEELAPLTGTTIVPLSRVLAQPGYRPDGEGGVPATGAQASHAVPLGTIEVPVVQGGTLCTLGSGDFVLVTGLATARADGAAATVRARCAVVSGRARRRPEPPPGPPASRRPA